MAESAERMFTNRGARPGLAVCRFVPVVLSLLFLPASLARAGDAPYPEAIKRIIDRGVLLVAQCKDDRPGFYASDNRFPAVGYVYKCKNDGLRLVGFDIDLAHEIATALGVDLEIVRQPTFNDACYAVASGRCDIALTKLSVTPDRSLYVRYTKPYISLRQGVLINRVQESRLQYRVEEQRSKRTTLAAREDEYLDLLALCDHPGARLGVIKGASYVDFTRERFCRATLVEFPNQEELFEAVRRGKVLAVLYEEFEIKRIMNTIPDMSIRCRAQFVPGREDHIAIAVSPESPTLVNYLNLLFAREDISPTVDDILSRYFPRGELEASAQVHAAANGAPTLYTGLGALLALLAMWIHLARRKSSARKG